MLLADAFDGEEKVAFGEADAAFALNGLQQKGGGLGADRSGKFIRIVEFEMAKAGEERVKSFLHLGLTGGGEGAEGAAVEGALEGEDFVASVSILVGPGVTKAAGKLDEAIVGLRAGVSEEDLTRKLQAFLHEALCEFCLLVDLVEIRTMDQFGGLLGDGLGEGVVSMTEGAGCEARAEIEVAIALGIPEQGALASHRRDGKLGVGREDVFSKFFCGGHEREVGRS